ncbi:MAG: NlpC/P60 family protein [Lachnospiraceae bacterium]|nr:NlpC/P60 family protein [Lachnospiraceae bacterium]
MKKRILCLFLGLSLALTGALPVLADQESDLQEQKDKNSAILNQTMDSLNQTQDAQDTLTQEISTLDNDLVNLMSNISLLEADIADSEQKLAETTVQLGEAQEQCDTQYGDMKTRIQYIYENDSSMTWLSFIAGANSLEDFLNRVFYTQELNEYDRRQLESFKGTVAEITELKTNLEYRTEELAEEEISLNNQKDQLNTALAEKKQQSDNYEAEIAALQEKANALTAEIAEQNAQLLKIQEEKRRAAEEAARKAAEEEARRQQEAANNNNNNNNSNPGNTGNTGSTNTGNPGSSGGPSTPAPSGDAAARALALANQYASGSPYYSRVLSANTEAAANQYAGIGQTLANFACQFVGNPYVVAGESLTHGADCAGFVKAVYANFGVHFDRNLELYNLMGTAVSFNDMMPGDVILYSAGGAIGHAAIYIGNNTIVNASSPEVGICVRSPANYRNIVSIRRFFCY